MLYRIFIVALLLIFGISNVLSAVQVPQGLNESQQGDNGTVLNVMQVDNESICQELLKTAWIQYREDILYSSSILDEFVEGKITNREAMITTTSIIVLTSRTIEIVNKMNPPAKYVKYHDYTANALEQLEEYLWCMSKFYETGGRNYILDASTSYNNSIYYYEKAIEESMLYL